MPVDGMEGLNQDRALCLPRSLVPVGEALLGRVVDALGRPLTALPCRVLFVTPLRPILNPLRQRP